MKHHGLSARTSIAALSLLMVASFLPLNALAKDFDNDSNKESNSEQTTLKKAKKSRPSNSESLKSNTSSPASSETESAESASSKSTSSKFASSKSASSKSGTSKSGSSKSKSSKPESKSKSSKSEKSTSSTPPADRANGIADPKSAEILHAVSDFYLNLKSWQTRLIQKLLASSDTKTVELLSVVEVGVKKPDQIAITLKAGMPGGSMLCDGTNSYFYSQILNKYNVKPQPEDLEKVFGDPSSRYVNGPYALYSLLPSLVSKDPYDSIMAGVKKVEYVGADDIDGTPCHHIRFTQEKFVWDLWVDSGKSPWIVKVSPDLFADLAGSAPRALGRIPKSTKMSLTFRYKNWLSKPNLKKSYFTFTPPPESSETKTFSPDTNDEKTEKSSLIGKDAPTFKLALTDGKECDLSKHKDKDVVILDFWATWCPPCRESLPVLTRVSKNFANKHVVFYPVNVGEDAEKVKAYLTKADLDVTAALDTDKKVSALYGVSGIPQTVVIDKNGVIKVLDVGYSSDMEQRLTSEIESILKNKSGN